MVSARARALGCVAEAAEQANKPNEAPFQKLRHHQAGSRPPANHGGKHLLMLGDAGTDGVDERSGSVASDAVASSASISFRYALRAAAAE